MLKHEKVKVWESCLSVPGLAGKVPRYANVLVHYLDEDGRKKRLAATGYLAGKSNLLLSISFLLCPTPPLFLSISVLCLTNLAMFQHEVDHLNGILFVDHLETLKDLCFDEEYFEYRASDPEDCYEGTVRFFDK